MAGAGGEEGKYGFKSVTTAIKHCMLHHHSVSSAGPRRKSIVESETSQWVGGGGAEVWGPGRGEAGQFLGIAGEVYGRRQSDRSKSGLIE